MKIRGYLRRTDLSRCIEPDEASSCRDCPTRRASEHDLFCLTAIHVALHGETEYVQIGRSCPREMETSFTRKNVCVMILCISFGRTAMWLELVITRPVEWRVDLVGPFLMLSPSIGKTGE